MHESKIPSVSAAGCDLRGRCPPDLTHALCNWALASTGAGMRPGEQGNPAEQAATVQAQHVQAEADSAVAMAATSGDRWRAIWRSRRARPSREHRMRARAPPACGAE
jgi:hypothetical protein